MQKKKTNEGDRSDSDFHSFHSLGYRAAYVAEGIGAPWYDLTYGNVKHSAYDLISGVDLKHVAAVASVAFGFIVEMSF